MRPTGKDGRLYNITYGMVIVGGAAITIATAGFFKVVSKAATGSGFPAVDTTISGGQPLKIGSVYWAKAGQSLVEGDSVKPMSLKLLSFATDIQDNASGTSHDVTTQADVESGSKSYVAGAFKERSGSINGMVDVDSDEQRILLNEYREIVVQDDTHATRLPAKTASHEYMMSRRETIESGEKEMWEYMPLISESLNTAKPMDGVQSFSINYKIDGQRNPSTIIREVS